MEGRESKHVPIARYSQKYHLFRQVVADFTLLICSVDLVHEREGMLHG